MAVYNYTIFGHSKKQGERMNEITGRDREIEKLSEFYNSNKSEFMAIYGRRRIGKTYLINKYFKQKKCCFFSASGLADCTFTAQREAFCAELSEQLFNRLPLEVPKTWFKIFELLDTAIKNTDKRFVIFLDEFPWLATARSKLLQTVEYFWNQRWSAGTRVKLIICGSLSSWIIRNILENTGGLYHRVTYRLHMEPFGLYQTQQFLKVNNQVDLTYQQIIKIYMVMGGVPLYLERVQKGKTANQIIDEICFNREGLLFDEMHELFKSLFKNSVLYMNIARIIAKNHYGISKRELVKETKISIGGRLNERLQELEEAGFIQSFLPYQHKEKGVYYRISDEYTKFYFFWIEPNLHSIKNLATSSGYWLTRAKEARYQAWKGYAFETICYKSIVQILKTLKLSLTSVPYTWRYQPLIKSSDNFGVQIDLLFERDDDAITLCEIKHTDKPFVVDKNYAEILKKKKDTFLKITQTTKQVFFILISVNGIKENEYSRKLFDNIIVLEDLFTPI